MTFLLDRLRLAIVCLAAASAGLSMVFVSLSKLLLIAAGLVFLLCSLFRGADQGLQKSASVWAVVGVLSAFAASLWWTVGPVDEAMASLGKYGKLLSIALMMALIRKRHEALLALLFFMVGQAFLVLSSWLLFFQLPLPWATSNMAQTEYAVFSSYLDQGIITAVAAALFWHLRAFVPGRYGPQLAVVLALVCLLNVVFVLSGRTGHVVAIVLASLAIMWQLPRRYRPAVVVLPFVLCAVLFVSSDKLRERLTMVKQEVELFHQSSASNQVTSSGIRLKLWIDSIRIIEQHPVAGAGVGSWSTEYNRLGRASNPQHIDAGRNFNPHQEYLLWGVQLGLPGIVLFCALLLAMAWDASRLEVPLARAAQSAAAGLAVAALFNSSLYDALIGDFFCITVGLLLAFRHRSPEANGASRPAALSRATRHASA